MSLSSANREKRTMAIVKTYQYNVTFEEHSASISEENSDPFRLILVRWPGLADYRMRIVGYSDRCRENDELSLLRAEHVRDYFLNNGVSETRIDNLGSCQFGGEKSEYPDYYRRVDVCCYKRQLCPA